MTLISWNIIHTEAKFKDEKQKEEDYWWERWFNFDKEAKTRNVSYLNILMTIKKFSFENILYKMIWYINISLKLLPSLNIVFNFDNCVYVITSIKLSINRYKTGKIKLSN